MSIFRFKQFTVDQTGCAMRINTDGVLLAVHCQAANPGRILDIGTGTGVIALMVAQRFAQAKVDAVEIDVCASQTASANFKASVFADRMDAYCCDIADFETENRYDLIVSNPPYFVNDLKNIEHKKGVARHASHDFFAGLCKKVSRLLADEGLFWVVLPVKQAENLVQMFKDFNIYLHSQIQLYSDDKKPEFRRILCLGRAEKILKIEKFTIYKAEHEYTNTYKMLLKPFFANY